MILSALAIISSACVAGDSETTTDGETASTIGAQAPTSVVVSVPDAPSTSESPTSSSSDNSVEDEPDPPPSSNWRDLQFELRPVASVSGPIDLTARSGSQDLWLAERPGRVRRIERQAASDGGEQTLRLSDEVVLDITDAITTEGEGGLLGLTFSPDGRFLYTSYTNNGGDSVVAEYEMGATAALRDTERLLIEVPQPYSNHNGGQIVYGPDGYLYLALGDGGSGGDPLNSGQDTQTLLGSILRIDPTSPTAAANYGVPAGNPFAGSGAGRPEIWLWGVRNPWRFSFDRQTGDLWIGDVGQSALEEITVLRRGSEPAGRGANLGWRIMEGDQLFDGDQPPPDHRPPLFTYDHGNGRCSVTGGYVYRGSAIPALDGVYLFGDYCTGEIFGLQALDDGQLVVANLVLDRSPGQLISFGQGPDGELYVLGADGGVSLLQSP